MKHENYTQIIKKITCKVRRSTILRRIILSMELGSERPKWLSGKLLPAFNSVRWWTSVRSTERISYIFTKMNAADRCILLGECNLDLDLDLEELQNYKDTLIAAQIATLKIEKESCTYGMALPVLYNLARYMDTLTKTKATEAFFKKFQKHFFSWDDEYFISLSPITDFQEVFLLSSIINGHVKYFKAVECELFLTQQLNKRFRAWKNQDLSQVDETNDCVTNSPKKKVYLNSYLPKVIHDRKTNDDIRVFIETGQLSKDLNH